MNDFNLYGLTRSDFRWFCVGNVDSFKKRELPQIVGEFSLNKKPLVVDVIPSQYQHNFKSSINLIYENVYLIVHDNFDYYVHHSLKYATKRSDGYVYIGLKK
ncbi:hypothetical protein IHC92_20775 [Photobacterium damselae subsp. damselae]|uniref:hypothetical protein n=1 Tax=Photobacterium damselae TaxID=38293 RepID=UPI001F465762|nr:hypothetical protein [Photobacterium damselae]UKA23389.1 hypothetical protein IHC92_20775 [Photobacterium damselae subsp. damselae]